MNHEVAIRILESITTSEGELKHHLILGAVRYARLRTDWQLATPEERCAMDPARTAVHNALVDAAKHLRARDQWIGWTDAQREKRLSLVVNNIRFLLIPDKTFPCLLYTSDAADE